MYLKQYREFYVRVDGTPASHSGDPGSYLDPDIRYSDLEFLRFSSVHLDNSCMIRQ
jgi:hypothetical protein